MYHYQPPHLGSTVLVVVCKANKMLGLLRSRKTCPMLTNTKVRSFLYLSLVKCQLDYATKIWSPALASLKIKIENVQRRTTRRILKQRKGEQSYKGRLVALKLLPLCYEEKDVVSFYKAMHGHIFHIFHIWHIFQKSLIVLINNFTPSCVIT